MYTDSTPRPYRPSGAASQRSMWSRLTPRFSGFPYTCLTWWATNMETWHITCAIGYSSVGILGSIIALCKIYMIIWIYKWLCGVWAGALFTHHEHHLQGGQCLQIWQLMHKSLVNADVAISHQICEYFSPFPQLAAFQRTLKIMIKSEL